MPRSRIPDPIYLHETVEGGVYELPEGMTLVVGRAPSRLTAYAPLWAGPVVTRYAIPLLSPSIEAILPGLFVSEKGVALTGREAWNFVLGNFQMYPRADVVGMRSKDGAPMQVFLRELDFGAPIQVLAYNSVDVSIAPIPITRLLIGEDAAPLPELLSTYLAAL